MAELARKGGFVVPWSNDVGMDHFCGPLPESRHAGRPPAGAAASLGTAPPPRVVRPSCLLAGREDMALLADSHLVDPRLQLELIELPVTIARAVVAHDSTCTASLLAPSGPDGRPLLVASMIVRDEEADAAGSPGVHRGPRRRNRDLPIQDRPTGPSRWPEAWGRR